MRGILARVTQNDLFAGGACLPEGFVYAANFLSAAEEAQLLEELRALPFQAAPYRQWQARRRIVSFGGRYDFTVRALQEAPPIPEFLHPLRAAVASWAGLEAERIAHAMVNEYAPGAPLGWHRDIGEFEDIAGVSLAGRARLRLRPWPPAPRQRATHTIELAPRSVYTLRGAARWGWQHAISPTKELRYSITFRTRRH
jgi:alkylated DNA repair dioxygenase AlkB